MPTHHDPSEPDRAVTPKAGYHRTILRALRVILLIYAVWLAFLYVMQTRLIFPAGMAGPQRPVPRDPRTVIIRLDVDPEGSVAETIEAWFIPARQTGNNGTGPATPRTSPAVIFFHGNAELIDQQHWIVDHYQQMGFAVLLPEYRGYGRSAGKPSQEAIVSDAVRFYDQLVERPGIDPERIVFHGRSIGGAIAAHLAVQRKPAVLILESTPANVASMAYRYAAPPILVKNPFRTDRVLPTLTDTPILLFHGSYDTIIPPSNAQRLHTVAPNSELVLYRADHNYFPGPNHEADYWQQIRTVLTRAGLIRGG